MLVSTDTYRRLTSDVTTLPGDVEEALLEAQRAVEEALDGRVLEYGTYTETLPVYGDRVYPKATPIAEAAGNDIVGHSVVVPLNGIFWQKVTTYDLTYSGGFTTQTLPVALRNAIIATAQDQLQGASSTAYPTGATNVKLGDASVTFAEPVQNTLSGELPDGVLKSIQRYRRAVV